MEPVGLETVEVEAAALVALAGIDVHAFLTCEDPLLLATMQAVATRTRELRELERQDLAVRIRNEIVEAFAGG